MAACLGLLFSLQVVAQTPDSPPPPPPPGEHGQLDMPPPPPPPGEHGEHPLPPPPPSEHKAHIKGGHKQGMHQHKQEMRKHKQAYKAEVLPLLQQQRVKFEQILSTTDKQKIESLRGEMEALKPQFKALREQKKAQHLNQTAPSEEMKTQFHALREQKKAIMVQAAQIAKSYESELMALHEEIKPELDAFHAKMRAQHQAAENTKGPHPKCATKDGDCKKGRKADCAVDGKGQHHKQGDGQGKHPKQSDGQGEFKGKGKHHAHGPNGDVEGKHKMRMAAQFVLMNPNGTLEDIGETMETPEMEIFPNPSTSSNTVTYSLRKAGQVTIDLLNKEGQVLKTVFSGNQDAGSHTQQVDTQALGMDIYYYRITTDEDVIMKRFTVVKQ